MKFESNADWINFAKEQTHNDKAVMDEVNACAQSPKTFISEKALQMKSTAFRNDYISLAEDMANASDQEAFIQCLQYLLEDADYLAFVDKHAGVEAFCWRINEQKAVKRRGLRISSKQLTPGAGAIQWVAEINALWQPEGLQLIFLEEGPAQFYTVAARD